MEAKREQELKKKKATACVKGGLCSKKGKKLERFCKLGPELGVIRK